MKNQFAFFVSLLSLTAFGQINQSYQNNELQKNTDLLDEVSLNKKSKPENSKIEGSPYLNKMFAPANVSGVNRNAMLRYDAFSDEFEFVNAAKDTLVLNKVAPYTTITFTNSNTKYQLLDYNSNGKVTNGYLILLHNKDNFSLYKKQNIGYVKERLAKSGFDKNTPAHFENKKDTYYFKNGDKGIFEFPANKRELIKIYPERKDEIEAFLKQNNIDFDKEQDRVRIIDFVSA